MNSSKDPIQTLVDELKKLPGIGPKSAQRLVFHLLKQPDEVAERLSRAIERLKNSLMLCSTCNNLTDVDPCRFCRDSARDHRIICVVEEPFNIASIEKSGEYRGLYHVIHGTISPINGIGPEELKIQNLLARLGAGKAADQDAVVEEIILATNPTIEGEATALYLSRLIKPLGVKISRIALGIPVGSDLEYVDSVTLSRALSGRQLV